MPLNNENHIFDTQLLARKQCHINFAACDFLWQYGFANLQAKINNLPGRHNVQGMQIIGGHQHELLHKLVQEWDGQLFDHIQQINNKTNVIILFLHGHYEDDLPGLLKQCHDQLADNGILIGIIPGGRSLQELRTACLQLDSQRNIAAARVIPMIDVKDMGRLLSQAGFASITTDSELITVLYHDVTRIFADIKAQGQRNCLRQRSTLPLTRGYIKDLQTIWQDLFPHPSNLLPLHYELIGFTAWKQRLSEIIP